MHLAIIPARGGSKRIPRKNIKKFHGKPIIAYSIVTALKSGLFDKVIVSTDDKEIAKIAEYYGAEVPFIRPENISDDHATTNDVISHSILWYKEKGICVDKVCCIYATAPFLKSDDLLLASKMFDDETKFVFGATEFSYPIFRSFKLNTDKNVTMFWPDFFDKRSQDIEKAYHDVGMFYCGKASAFLENKPIFSNSSKAYVMPNYRAVDIDTMDDWCRAENLYKLLELGNATNNF